MSDKRCGTCRYANYHGNYDKTEPILCTNDKSEKLFDFMNKYDGCEYYDSGFNQNLQVVITKIRNQLLSDKELYNALVASIESAIYDNGAVCDLSDQHNLAEEIADRIIGREE